VTDNVAHDETGDASRRGVMGGFVALGVAVPLLAACGSDDSGSGSAGNGDADTGSSGDSGSAGGTTSSGAIGKTTDVPVGSAKIYSGEKVMVSQPTEGEFRAFSAVCTHQQCAITKLDGDEIECTCHFSRFKTADGSVAKGPATKPLEELEVTVTGEDLSVS
jgi:nitrite reductase/ring-hydroxylating ferredoxin subunit